MVDDCREKGYVIPELDSFVRHAILEILFDWPLLLSYIEGKENKLKAVIVINTRKKQADYIAKRLQKKLGDYYQFSVMPNFNQKELLGTSPDKNGEDFGSHVDLEIEKYRRPECLSHHQSLHL